MIKYLIISWFLLSFHFSPIIALTSGQILTKNFLKFGSTNNRSYDVRYYETFIDHFGYGSDEKFKIKYLINENSYAPGGAIFFYTGNEGLIEVFAENTGAMWQMAPHFKATIIFMEHRYYGESMPFGKESFADRSKFAFFTAEQALADFASFLDSFKTNNKKYKYAPVIAFGGSYGGMLSAWFRAKYPNIVTGALAASAPVFGFTNMTSCEAFNLFLTNAFSQTGSQNCVDAIKKSWTIINSRDPKNLKEEFKLCKTLPAGELLGDYLSEFYGEIAMVNYPYPASFLGDFPAWPVREFCKPFLNVSVTQISDKQLMELIAEGLFNNMNYTGTLTCLDITFNEPGVNYNAWYLQTCLEMQLPICSNGVDDMFQPKQYDPVKVANECANDFKGVKPRFEWPNVQFWGKKLPYTYTNVIFSNGALDPWASMGVLKASDAPGATVMLILNGAHHIDLRESHPNEPDDLKIVRTMEWNTIQKWIDSHYNDMFD